MSRRRTLLLTALALAVPLPAFAVSGEEAPSGPATLTVTASLDSCGVAEETVVCKIDASWNSLPGATRYTASVTRADGSVIDYGSVGTGGTSFWVPYVGAGTYTVEISAWGRPPGADRPKLLDEDSSRAGGRQGSLVPDDTGSEAATDDSAVETPLTDDPAAEAPVEEPPVEEPPVEEPPVCEEPPLEEPPVEEPPVEPTEPEAGEVDAAAAEAPEPVDAPAAEEPAEVPDELACPEPSG